MVRIKHFAAPQKMPNFPFSRRAKWPWPDKILVAPQRGQKIIVNQSKPILVIVLIKPLTCQRFRQNYFLSEIEWAVMVHKCLNGRSPDYLSQKCTRRQAHHDRNARYKKDLDLPRFRLKTGQRSFAFRGATCWNKLPKDILIIIIIIIIIIIKHL